MSCQPTSVWTPVISDKSPRQSLNKNSSEMRKQKYRQACQIEPAFRARRSALARRSLLPSARSIGLSAVRRTRPSEIASSPMESLAGSRPRQGRRMTRQRGQIAADSKHTPPEHTPRLRLKPKAPTSGYVDGAWWPHSDQLPIELPDLLAVLSVRLGPIDRVVYNLAEWADAPTKLPVGRRVVRLSGFYRQPVNTVEVLGANQKLVLLVVPPRTDPVHAHETMMAAAAPNNASTIDGLLND